MTSGQTRASKSFLLTISFGVDVRTTKMSRARAPNSTGTPSLVRRRSFTSNLKGPNDRPPSVRLIAVAIHPSWNASVQLPFQRLRPFLQTIKAKGTERLLAGLELKSPRSDKGLVAANGR